MITINKGQSNSVVLTLSEKCTLSAPVFLFKFTSVSTKQSQYFISADTSTQTHRYNRFTIVEKSNPDNLDGEVSLDIPGQWLYQVYEQESTTNLNPELSDNTSPVEIGRVNVIGTVSTNTAYEPSITNKVYNG